MFKAMAISGINDYRLPRWGRSFWQDPNDGALFLAFASGNQANTSWELDYIYSINSGVSWSNPALLAQLDNFYIHDNFDTFMDYHGHIHAGFRLNNSGCYQFFGRMPGGGWTASSGIGVVGLNQVQDTGVLKGWQGSITRIETSYTFSGGLTSFPCVVIANKNETEGINLHVVTPPFNTSPTLNYSTTSVGPEGGYPIIFTNWFANGPGLVAQSGSDLIMWEDFLSWDQITPTLHVPNGVQPFSSNLCFGSGAGYRASCIIVSCTPSGQEIYANNEAASFVATFRPIMSGYSPNSSGTWRNKFPTNIFGVDPSGTHCDFSFTDTPSVHQFYFYGKDNIGRPGIQRILGEYIRPTSSSQTTKWQFTDILHGVSGIKNVAPVDATTTGGVNSIAYWRKFKAVKHPVSAGVKRNPLIHKGEFLVTSSYVPSIPSGSALNIFEVTGDEVGPNTFPIPSFQRDYTEDNLIFDAIVSSGGFTTSPNYSFLFDRSTATAVTLSTAGGFLSIRLKKPVLISKVEFTKQFSRNWGRIAMSGSLDGTNWYTIASTGNSLLPTNKGLVYLSAEDDPDDLNNLQRIEMPTAKFIRLFWTGGGAGNSTQIHTLRIWGPGGTRDISTSFDSFSLAYAFNNRAWQPQRSVNTERFVYQHDSVPPHFDCYGDLIWKVKASGELTRTNSLPGAPPLGDGLIPTGTWLGTSYGEGDGFAFQSEITNNVGYSGVAQAYVQVSEGSRTFRFSKKLDLHPDDKFEVYRKSPSDVDGSGTLMAQSIGASLAYTTNTFSLAEDGQHVIRFIYIRGSGTDSTRAGAVWLDNIVGLSQSQPSVLGYIRGEGFGASGIINAYINGKETSYIFGYLPGIPLDSSIYAYMDSRVFPDYSSSIDAYMFGKGSWFWGYMLGGSGLASIPTGSIYGYMAVGVHPINSTINAYLAESQINSINAYLQGRQLLNGSGAPNVGNDNRINAYMLANNPTSTIYAIMNPSGQVGVGFINAYAKGYDGEQTIYAYLHMESGIGKYINAYTEGWSYSSPPQNMIWAVMPGIKSSTSGNINSFMLSQYPYERIYGYMGPSGPSGGGAVAGGPGGAGQSTSGVLPTNIINGFMKAYDGFQTIWAYLHKDPAATSNINAYLAAGSEENTIYGYIYGKGLGSGIVYGYASGIGFENPRIYAYLPGVSGIENSRIYAYSAGHITTIDSRDGILLGMPASSGEGTRCFAFQLMPEETATIPTNTYPGMLI